MDKEIIYTEGKMIIGLSGYPNSGKSTAQKYIVDKYKFFPATFAKNLKEMCKECFHLTNDQVYTQQGKEEVFNFILEDWMGYFLFEWINRTHPIPVKAINKIEDIINDIPRATTPRHILRIIGTEVCRQVISDTYHIDVVKHNIQKHNNVIFDDARFPNEFALCTCKILLKRQGSIFTLVHASDNLLPEDEYNHVLDIPDGDLDYLYKKIDMIIEIEEAKEKPEKFLFVMDEFKYWEDKDGKS